MSDDDPWARLDDIESEASRDNRSDQFRRHYLNQVERPAVEGRVLRPGDPSPGRNQSRPEPDPEGQQLMMMPLEGRPIPGGTYGAFVLDGPAAGQWRVEHDGWRAVEMDHARDAMWYATTTGKYADESLSMKTTMYRLQRLAIGTTGRLVDDPGERRQYWFWSSVPVWEMDPAAAVFALIDAEPWQAQMCRVPDRARPRF